LPGGVGGTKGDEESAEDADEERYKEANEALFSDPEVSEVTEEVDEPDEEGEGNLRHNREPFPQTKKKEIHESSARFCPTEVLMERQHALHSFRRRNQQVGKIGLSDDFQAGIHPAKVALMVRVFGRIGSLGGRCHLDSLY
jgi:hypothetical protein